MQDFPERQEFENMGGILEFQFVPLRDIAIFPVSENGEYTTDIQFVEGKKWLKGYSVPFKSSYDEQVSINEVGYIFKKPFTGFFPMQSKEALAQFNEMKTDYHIIKVKDSNQRTRLVGTPESPCVFSFAPSTGNDPSQNAGYVFTFSVDEKESAPFYLNEDLAGGSFGFDFNEDFN